MPKVIITVTSRKDISFPDLSWSIKRGELKELPSDEKISSIILSSQYIRVVHQEVPKEKTTTKKSSKKNN